MSFCIYTTGDDLNQLVDGHSYSLSLSYWLYTTHELNRGDTITIMLYTAKYMKYILDYVGFNLYRKTYGFYLLIDKICNNAQIAEVCITKCLLCFMRWLSFIQRLTIQRLCSQHDLPFSNSTTKMICQINDAILIAKLIT